MLTKMYVVSFHFNSITKVMLRWCPIFTVANNYDTEQIFAVLSQPNLPQVIYTYLFAFVFAVFSLKNENALHYCIV